MSTRLARSIFVAVAALLAVMALSSTATASRGIITPGLLVLFTGTVTMAYGPINQICNLWLGITLQPLILKRPGALVGILGFSLSRKYNCNGGITGGITANSNITYASFTGSLPNITGFNVLLDLSIFLRGGIFGAGCTFTAAPGTLRGVFSGAAGTVTRGTLSGPITGTGGACPTAGTLAATLTAMLPVVLRLQD